MQRLLDGSLDARRIFGGVGLFSPKVNTPACSDFSDLEFFKQAIRKTLRFRAIPKCQGEG